MRNTLPVLSYLLLLGVFAHGQNASFYKERPFFSTAPDPNKSVETIARFGPVGLSIESGGFSEKNPANRRTPLMVMKRG